MNNLQILQIENLTKELEDENNKYNKLLAGEKTFELKSRILKKINSLKMQLGILKNQEDDDSPPY